MFWIFVISEIRIYLELETIRKHNARWRPLTNKLIGINYGIYVSNVQVGKFHISVFLFSQIRESSLPHLLPEIS